MRHADYKYVNVAVNGVQNRKGVYDITRLGNPTGKNETYATYFRYNEDMTVHYGQKGTVAGYTGRAYSEWLPIDIDSEDLEQAQMYLRHLVMNMDDLGIDSNSCRFYFSGAKGFHVMIPSDYFQAEPSDDINKRFRKVAIEIASGINIDSSIYDKTRIFRLPNTINAKTGLYKIELYPFDAMSLSIEDLKTKAKEPTDKLDIEKDIDSSETLTQLYHEPLDKIKIDGKQTKVKTKVCMSKLMQGVGQGNRDNVGVRVSSHLRQSGLTPKMIFVALDEWNDSNDPPLSDSELSRIFKQGLEEYEFGCHDYILKNNCDKDCLFYRKEWNRF